MLNVHLPYTPHFSNRELMCLLFQAICPEDSSALHNTLPLLLFYGRTAVCPPGQLLIRRLSEDEEPRSWNELVRLKQFGGYLEILFRCRGGSGTIAAQLAAHQPPSYDDSLNWTSIDGSLDSLAQGTPIDTSAVPAPVVALASHLFSYLRVDSMPLFRSLPNDYEKFTPARLLSLVDLARRGSVPHPDLPPWYAHDHWYDLRINSLSLDALGPQGQRIRQNPRQDTLVPLFLDFMQLAVSELRALRLDVSQSSTWEALKLYTVIKCNPGQSQYLSVCMLMPPEPAVNSWRSSLLRSITRVSARAYFTFNTTSTFVETELSRFDSDVLRTVGFTLGSLGLEDNVFMALLSQAFSRAWGGTFVQCRYGCETRFAQGNQRVSLADPRSSSCTIIVGVDLATLIVVNRNSSLTKLDLGVANELPVSMVVETPPPPLASLHAMFRAASPALQHIPLDGTTIIRVTKPYIVIGPLGQRWLSDQSKSEDRVTHREYLHSVLNELRRAGYDPFPIAKQGQAPFALLLACSDAAAASTMVVALRDQPQTQDLFERLLGSCDAVFETSLPPECIALQGPSALKDLLRPPTAGGTGQP